MLAITSLNGGLIIFLYSIKYVSFVSHLLSWTAKAGLADTWSQKTCKIHNSLPKCGFNNNNTTFLFPLPPYFGFLGKEIQVYRLETKPGSAFQALIWIATGPGLLGKLWSILQARHRQRKAPTSSTASEIKCFFWQEGMKDSRRDS